MLSTTTTSQHYRHLRLFFCHNTKMQYTTDHVLYMRLAVSCKCTCMCFVWFAQTFLHSPKSCAGCARKVWRKIFLFWAVSLQKPPVKLTVDGWDPTASSVIKCVVSEIRHARSPTGEPNRVKYLLTQVNSVTSWTRECTSTYSASASWIIVIAPQ